MSTISTIIALSLVALYTLENLVFLPVRSAVHIVAQKEHAGRTQINAQRPKRARKNGQILQRLVYANRTETRAALPCSCHARLPIHKWAWLDAPLADPTTALCTPQNTTRHEQKSVDDRSGEGCVLVPTVLAAVPLDTDRWDPTRVKSRPIDNYIGE